MCLYVVIRWACAGLIMNTGPGVGTQIKKEKDTKLASCSTTSDVAGVLIARYE